MSYETRYAAMKRQQEHARASTPEALADRLAARRASDRTREAVHKKFPELTAENMQEAIAFQQACFDQFVAEERSHNG